MGNNLSNFEQLIKETVNQHDIPYDETKWEQLQSHLPKGGQFNWINCVAGAAVVAMLIAGSTFWYYNSEASASSAALVDVSFKETKPLWFNPSGELVIPNNAIKPQESEAESLLSLDKSTNLNNENGSSETVQDLAIITMASAAESNEENRGEIEEDNPLIYKSEEDDLVFGINANSGCEGTSIQFNLMTDIPEGNYLWNFGDGNFSNEKNPAHTYLNQGVYDITLSVTNSADGQIRTETIKDLIVINPTPKAVFEWSFETDGLKKPSAQIENNSQHADQCEWIVDGEIVSSEINPFISFTKKGEHSVQLKASNQYGCEATKYHYINVDKDYKLLAREQISPNGDGKYDSFMPEALKNADQAFELTIYQGQEEIFRSTSWKNVWEGQMANGNIAQPGEQFPWVVILHNKNGEEEYYSGTITIVP